MEQTFEWVVDPIQRVDTSFEIDLQPCEITRLDFDRSIVVFAQEQRHPSFQEILQLSARLCNPRVFLTVFTQCVMVEPLLHLRKEFPRCHMIEVQDPLIYEVSFGEGCVVVDVYKTLSLAKDPHDLSQRVTVHVQHVNFLKSKCDSVLTVANLRYHFCA